MNDPNREHQEAICIKYKTEKVDSPNQFRVGISQNVRDGVLPINGVRITPQGDSTGWFIWAGEWSDAPDFFRPLHVVHLKDWCPTAIPFLLLPPGWRFQVAPKYEDVWFDADVKTGGQ
jgi:hypothetical protein